jgi:tetratricopeptide (TPR) repeat protein
MSPRFSIVVLARNESRTLPRLLASLRSFTRRGGELVVADTGSSDDTAAWTRRAGFRAVELGDRFASILSPAQAEEIERRFARDGEGRLVVAGRRLFHFAEARNAAGAVADHDFVLQIDAADEVLAMDIDRLDRHLASGTAETFEYEQRYGTAVLRIARFYDRRRCHWQGRVHEILTRTEPRSTPTASPIRCGEDELMVLHHKDDRKARQYLAGLALQVLETPEAPRWWHYLGRELLYRRCHRSAIAALEVHAEMADAWRPERSQSLCFIGECHEALLGSREAEVAYRRACETDATRREPLLRLASFACRHGNFEEGERLARTSLALERTSAYPEPAANYTWMPHSLLYWSLFWLGRRDEARAHWETYLKLCPKSEQIREHARLFEPTPSPASLRQPT